LFIKQAFVFFCIVFVILNPAYNWFVWAGWNVGVNHICCYS